MIEEDTITCALPTIAAEGNHISLRQFTHLLNLFRISSAISKRVAALKNLSNRSEDLISVICELYYQLVEWRDSLPSSVRPDALIDLSRLPNGYSLTYLIFLHYTYYGSVIALHSLFSCPWHNFAGSSPSIDVANQVTTSSDIIIKAARHMVLMTKHVRINASMPGWYVPIDCFSDVLQLLLNSILNSLILYYPLVGFVNVFIHVLKYPTLPSTRSDIALMDMVVGHFGHLGFLSASEAASSFTRQLVMIAYTTANKAQQQAMSQEAANGNRGG